MAKYFAIILFILLSLDLSQSANVKWNKRHLTYTILNRPSYLPFNGVRNAFQRAFNTWASVSPLSFSFTNSRNADVKLSFQKLALNSGGGVNNGITTGDQRQVKFNIDNRWVLNGYGTNVVNLYVIALHEFGHVLGLKHSNNPKSVMYDTSFSDNPNFNLLPEDIRAIQRLYPSRNFVPNNIRRFSFNLPNNNQWWTSPSWSWHWNSW